MIIATLYLESWIQEEQMVNLHTRMISTGKQDDKYFIIMMCLSRLSLLLFIYTCSDESISEHMDDSKKSNSKV